MSCVGVLLQLMACPMSMSTSSNYVVASSTSWANWPVKLGFDAAFVETPNKRIDEFMQRGRIHVICNSNPQWIDKPERNHWSAPLYSEEDVLLLHREHAPI